jgi:hypothetical protein
MPNIVTAVAHLGQIESASRALDVALPKQFVAAVAKARALKENAERIGGNAAELGQAVLNCLREGTDYRTDPQVQALLTERVIAANGIGQAGADAAGDMITETVNEHADEVLSSLAAAVDDDAATLASAAEFLSNVDDLNHPDVGAIRRSGQGRTALWGQAVDAADRIRHASNGWRAVAEILHVQNNPNHSMFVLTSCVDPAIIAAARALARNGKPDAWQLARADADIALAASIGEYMERVAGHTAAIAAANDAAPVPS